MIYNNIRCITSEFILSGEGQQAFTDSLVKIHQFYRFLKKGQGFTFPNGHASLGMAWIAFEDEDFGIRVKRFYSRADS
jgi:hypothetical protein